MDIIKFFYEEPASLEQLTPDLDPDARGRDRPAAGLDALRAAPFYARGYLAGTDLAAGRIGLTAVARTEAFVVPLLDWLGPASWRRVDAGGAVTALSASGAARVLADPAGTLGLVCGDAGGGDEAVGDEDLLRAVEGARRYALPALRRVLDGVRLFMVPEPAHHGADWSLFSAHPIRDGLVAAFARHPLPDVRRFAIPHREARSEEKFYFEHYDLERYAGAEIC